MYTSGMTAVLVACARVFNGIARIQTSAIIAKTDTALVLTGLSRITVILTSFLAKPCIISSIAAPKYKHRT